MTDRDLATFFIRNGYLRAPGILEPERMGELEDVVERQFRAAEPPLRANAAGEVSRIDGLLDRDPVFLSVLRDPHVTGFVTAVLGPDVEVLRDRHNQATLNRAGDIPFRLHRDVRHWSRPIVSVFIYIDEASERNGCTHVVPGSHVLPYAGPQSCDGGGTWADEHEPFEHLNGQALPVPMPRGGVLLVDGLTFHSVGVNHTNGTRRSIVFACHSSDDLRRTEDSSRELLVGTRRYRGSSTHVVSGSLMSQIPTNARR
jgi:ectoine hydroxylase-related dioxygenase (phytanoyl-CoA dioxygenase family)